MEENQKQASGGGERTTEGDQCTLDYGSEGSDLSEILHMELEGVDCDYPAEDRGGERRGG